MVLPYAVKQKKYWRNWASVLYKASHAQYDKPTSPAALRLIPFFVGSTDIDKMEDLMKGRD